MTPEEKPKPDQLKLLRSYFPDVVNSLQEHQLEWLTTSVQMFSPRPDMRGSGRTFASICGALMAAAMNPNQTIYYVDHYPMLPGSRVGSGNMSWVIHEFYKVIGLFPKYFQPGFQIRQEDHHIAIKWSAV